MKNKKVAIVTGGNRGIGLGITKAFMEAGYLVIVGARKSLNIENLEKDGIFFVYTDVRKEKYHQNLVKYAIDKFGRLDVYSIMEFSFWKPISEIEETFLSEILDTNLEGAFGVVKRLLKL